MLQQERPIDQLDMDAAVLHRLDGISDLHQLARGGFRIGEGAGLDEFRHRVWMVSTGGSRNICDKS
jgi:hypothetical protein